ncbi:redoxin domain-containing protein [Paractinoplanes maris]|uniref:redoxin domain-containing protein n=1 Tax=Paractinoplanes maris TaxID=1734446 RepID=UPI002022721E|nr:redoxin domain-containing protein [Actinoplanes maris]
MTTAAHSAQPAHERHRAREGAALSGSPAGAFTTVRAVEKATARPVRGGAGRFAGRPPNVLDRDDIWGRIVKPGARLPSVTLLEADLGPIHLDRLRMTGPIVLVFFPYASSAQADAALAGYERRLVPALAGTDAHLVAVSPQIPGRLAELKRRHHLSYFVAADPRHQLIDAFNLGFHAPGADVLLGARRSVLPFPAVVVVDRAGVVRFADVRPDGAALAEPALILAAVEALGERSVYQR